MRSQRTILQVHTSLLSGSCGDFNDGCCCLVARLIWKELVFLGVLQHQLHSTYCRRTQTVFRLFSLERVNWSQTQTLLLCSFPCPLGEAAQKGIKLMMKLDFSTYIERTTETVKHVGFIEANPNLFYISMNLLCKGFRYNAEQECNY